MSIILTHTLSQCAQYITYIIFEKNAKIKNSFKDSVFEKNISFCLPA